MRGRDPDGETIYGVLAEIKVEIASLKTKVEEMDRRLERLEKRLDEVARMRANSLPTVMRWATLMLAMILSFLATLFGAKWFWPR